MEPYAARAREFAVAAHGAQRYGKEPYSVHLDEVEGVVREMLEHEGHLSPILLRASAYLHDVFEDTPVGFRVLAGEFGEPMAHLVLKVTDPRGETRKARKALLHAFLRGLDRDDPALALKLADRLANVRRCLKDENQDLLRMYAREHHEFELAARRGGRWQPFWFELGRAFVGVPTRFEP